ncbi:PREDICTED: uncharacterized protein LOC109593142 [Amphimedon queenslandica]|uniref:Uncharacterized protein n=2 Tax=Amphimedon queenslandica TaxID=400682 RepID=A0AAN0K3J3_AMPQE|nr:PREDICTED: uncharacterized protein LOC109593142 [Amphimedon queenslandica]|eukprot:XP_019863921.1 PREDICTED: uncharacterized protein LOC109593142 [Amphimedon queenslandica]
MIKLLRHLHIIAEAKNRKEGSYFFPCALQSCKKLNPAPTEIQPLLIAWEIQNGGTKTLAIPQGLFPLTIVHLLEKKNIVQFAPDPDSDDETEFYRYHDAMSLRVFNEEYTIDIINRYTHIEIRFYDCKEFCPQIRELVMDAIKKSNNDLKVGKNHIFAFKCPRKNKRCYCIVKEDLSSTRCTQCRSHCKVLQGDDNSYRCWFSDCQSSSPGTKASLEDPPTKKRRLKLSASDRFRNVSDRLAGVILSCLIAVSGKLNAKKLITQGLHDEMITGHDIDSKKAAKLVLVIQTTLDAQPNPEAYLNDVCSALKELGEKQITDIVNELEQSKTD